MLNCQLKANYFAKVIRSLWLVRSGRCHVYSNHSDNCRCRSLCRRRRRPTNAILSLSCSVCANCITRRFI